MHMYSTCTSVRTVESGGRGVPLVGAVARASVHREKAQRVAVAPLAVELAAHVERELEHVAALLVPPLRTERRECLRCV